MEESPMYLSKGQRIAYKAKYVMMRNLFILAATGFIFAMAFLFGSAKANIEMRQELMKMEAK